VTQRTTPCDRPLAWETLVACWAGDLPPEEEEAVELHLMGCESCTAASQRVGATIEAIRAQPAAPALRVLPGERRDAPRAPPRPASRGRWFLGAGGAAVIAAAAALFLLLPRGAMVVSHRLPAPVRDAVTVEIAPAAAAREVRLEPELPQGVAVNGARLRRIAEAQGGGGWLTVRVEAGPPFAVVVDRSALSPGRYELELVSTTPDGAEQPRGFYRFAVRP
jgi:hypothetical protein